MKCVRCNHELDEGKSQCPSCLKWNTAPRKADAQRVTFLSDVIGDEHKRYTSGFWDKTFSEPPGIVTISANLLGGMPGAGKSTMALQMADGLADDDDTEDKGRPILYLPTEETKGQIRPRAVRLGLKRMDRIAFLNDVTTDLEDLGAIIKEYRPKAVILDSISGLTQSPQEAVEFCEGLKKLTQEFEFPAIITAHITKNDDLAGLMKLQHAVDAIFGLGLGLKDDARILMGYKNRFGPTDKSREVKMTMLSEGLISYVKPDKKKGKAKAVKKVSSKKAQFVSSNEEEEIF